MTDYYCDLEKAFADATGLDHAGAELTGPAGLQAAIRGTGNATKLAAGDTIYIKGTGDQSRLVLIDCNGSDVTGWGIGDVVHNKDGVLVWQGVVVETNAGGFLDADDIAAVWLDAGYDEDDILIADGVTNDDASGGAGDPTDVDPLAARSTPGAVFDGNVGLSSSLLEYVGVNAAWVEDGTAAVLDGGGKATNNIIASPGTANAVWIFRNICGKDAASHAWGTSSSAGLCHFQNCMAENPGGSGWIGDWLYATFYGCKAWDCGGLYGIRGTYGRMVHCTAYNCGIGLYPLIGAAIGCVAYENVTGFSLSYGSDAYNCVADSNEKGIDAPHPNCHVAGCRVTNNTTYGLFGVSYRATHTFYSGNAANWQNAPYAMVDGASTQLLGTDDGYIDGDNADLSLRNYGLTNQAQGRRMEVAL
ncbi:MAG: hypothetical protein HN350_14830 [Phycisphaerales bacterium]|jgi:hypothetical protein|nr:hypothetical protein [Phycisphaerales bacterium]